VNHRCLLDGIFAVCGVPEDKFRSICSAVDKLDKEEWVCVRSELVEEKGLEPAAADRIGEYVKLNGGLELVDKLEADAKLMANASAKKGLADMRLLLQFCEVYNCIDKVSFDLSLARGLDYYTGVSVHFDDARHGLYYYLAAGLERIVVSEHHSEPQLYRCTALNEQQQLIGLAPVSGHLRSRAPAVAKRRESGIRRWWWTVRLHSRHQSLRPPRSGQWR
jgi:hypothetical protein